MSIASAKHMSAVASLLEERTVRLPWSGCWIWMGSTNGNGPYGRGGYGVMNVDGTNRYVHRLAYEAYKNAVPDGKLVCHSCDVRVCVNPNHLFIADPMGNYLDMMAKGRFRAPGAPGDKNAARKNPMIVRGENNGRAVLKKEDIAAIRKAYMNGEQQRPIAKRYGVGQSQISRICRGEHWKSA